MENCSDKKEMNKVWLSYPKQRNRKPKTKFKSLERRLFLAYSLPLESPQALRCYGAVTDEHLDF